MATRYPDLKRRPRQPAAGREYRTRRPQLPRRPRFGVLKGNAEGSQPEVRRNFEASLEVLKTLSRRLRASEARFYQQQAAKKQETAG